MSDVKESRNVQGIEEGTMPHEQEQREKGSSLDLWEWLKALTIALLIAGLIRNSMISPIVVDGTSMYPTLENSENVIVNKAVYWLRPPKRGEIVVFHAEFDSDWIKRIIGLPGDYIEIKQGKLYINNELFEEDYLAEELFFSYGKEQHTFTVPEGHLLVLGDNREHSRDSRSIGPILMEQVYGRAEVVYKPLSKLRRVR